MATATTPNDNSSSSDEPSGSSNAPPKLFDSMAAETSFTFNIADRTSRPNLSSRPSPIPIPANGSSSVSVGNDPASPSSTSVFGRMTSNHSPIQNIPTDTLSNTKNASGQASALPHVARAQPPTAFPSVLPGFDRSTVPLVSQAQSAEGGTIFDEQGRVKGWVSKPDAMEEFVRGRWTVPETAPKVEVMVDADVQAEARSAKRSRV